MKIVKFTYDHFGDFSTYLATQQESESHKTSEERKLDIMFRGVRASVSAGEWGDPEDFDWLYNHVKSLHPMLNRCLVYLKSKKSYDNKQRHTTLFYSKEPKVCVPLSTFPPSKTYGVRKVNHLINCLNKDSETWDNTYEFSQRVNIYKFLKKYLSRLDKIVFTTSQDESDVPEVIGNKIILSKKFGLKFIIEEVNGKQKALDEKTIREVWSRCYLVADVEYWHYNGGSGIPVDIYYQE